MKFYGRVCEPCWEYGMAAADADHGETLERVPFGAELEQAHSVREIPDQTAGEGA